MDATDTEILHTIDLDARQPVSQIAKTMEIGQETARYRLNRLQEEVIKEFVTLLNASHFGLTTFRIHFRCTSLTKEKEEELKERLMECCYWLVRARGSWDFNTLFQTRSPARLKAFLDKLTYDFGDIIADYRVDIITAIHHFRRNLAKPSESKEVRVWESDVERRELDETDRCILETVQNNARMDAVEIADECGVTPRVVRYRLKKYEEEGIILGYRPALSIQGLDLAYVKVELSLEDQSEALHKRLYEYLRRQPLLLIYITEAIGGPDFEFELYIESTDELYRCIDDLRDEFEDHIAGWSWMEYTAEAKLSYLQEV